ncbi:hypothetical protein D3874_01925 [Oleomonas cavernae]|uniref:Flagellar hook-length control protein FliK n=1 Tax=Oleomonas cavernae TaxID=2320859 RepID=A0A418WTM1_9PROT|nr:hypothetical protein [Oleomonas cavernae]RJF94612.1 hypothetical protein D3874_01925 [Oleomonas cavernae]
MTDPVAGPSNATAVGLTPDSMRQPRDQGSPRSRAGTGGEAAAVPPPTAAASVVLAAELLRLRIGSLLTGLIGKADAQGRPTLTTAAGQFALLASPAAAGLVPGTPVSMVVQGAADTLSVLLLGPAGSPPRPLELLFLGANAAPVPNAPTRQLFAGTLLPAGGGPPQAIALHLDTEAPVLNASVTSRRPQADGTIQLRLATPEGVVTLNDAPAELDPGTRIALDIVARNGARSPASPLPSATTLPSLAGASPAVLQFAAGRTVLSDIERLLAAAQPDGGLSLARILPGLAQKDGQTAAVALLGAALKFRDFKRLVGDQRRLALEHDAGPAPMLRAGAEFGEIARAATEPAPQGWRPLVMPFFDGRQIVPVMIFVRPQEEPAGDPDEAEAHVHKGRRGTRFMVDLSLSELGLLQVDGFMQDKRIDTILRSRRPLDPDLRSGVEARYLTVLETAGFAGSLLFQVQDGPPGLVIGPPAAQPAGHISLTA